MFEKRSQKLLSRRLYLRRQLGSLLLGMGSLTIALFIGVAGYHWLGDLGWVDSILNASMILGGMGPVDTMHTAAAKLFASAYALFSGVVFIGAMAIVLGPAVHRMLHAFHVDDDEQEPMSAKERKVSP